MHARLTVLRVVLRALESRALGTTLRSAGVLRALPTAVFWELHLALKALFEDYEVSPSSWHDLIVLLLPPKVRIVRAFADFRGVCLINALSKLMIVGAVRMATARACERVGSRSRPSGT